MSDWYQTSMQRLLNKNADLEIKLINAEMSMKLYWVAALIGWILFFGVLIWPSNACAAESFTSIVIRCQQSDDTCIKREIRYPSEQACNEANEQVVEVIGKTNDIVIAYCVGDSE